MHKKVYLHFLLFIQRIKSDKVSKAGKIFKIQADLVKGDVKLE